MEKYGFYLELTKEEKIIINKLKKEHAINITQLLKNYMQDFYKKLKQK